MTRDVHRGARRRMLQRIVSPAQFHDSRDFKSLRSLWCAQAVLQRRRSDQRVNEHCALGNQGAPRR